MATPYIGEIRMFAGNFAPQGWMFCDGQLLSISDYTPLFALIGTTYGGDGQNTFGLPNLLGRVPRHQGSGAILGESAGVETITLTTNQMPAHNHPLQASDAGASSTDPTGRILAASSVPVYAGTAHVVPSSSVSTGVIGGSGQPHDNMQPYLCINFIISLFGVFPSQN